MASLENIEYVYEQIFPTPDQIQHWRPVSRQGRRLPLLLGTCPKCLHPNQIELDEQVVPGASPAKAAKAPKAHVTKQVVCACNIMHGSSASEGGCGRWWMVRLTPQENGDYQLSVDSDLSLLPALTALRVAVDGQDKAVQASAEKWATGVTAIYGLFSLIAVTTAKDAVTGLSPQFRILVAIAFLAAVVLAGTALWFSHRAAYDWPVAVDVSDNDKLQAWYERRRNYAVTAARHLRKAVWLAYVSLRGRYAS